VVRNLNGTYALSALARFIETQAGGNVLSTPNLLTLDNEEAKIVIGQNVPFVTGQYTSNNNSGTSVNPFQTIERKDVGLTLRVRPQISENGTVKMQIFQEVSSVQPGSINSASGLITNKRSIESNVAVDNGSIVVLGGLLQDEYAGNEQKLPGLGDLPLIGRLFKSETRSRKKTNLMVFLRPVVVRDNASSEGLALDRYDLMRVQQANAQPTPSSILPINASAIMPPLTPQTQAPSSPSSPSSPSAATPRVQTQPTPAAPLPAGRALPPAADRQ
jgi:general secretion pathway protein D